MFYRKIQKQLNEYYQSPDAPIMVITGARQVGKSFIIRETAKEYFTHYIEINLREDFDGEKIFEETKSVRDFYLQLSALYGANLGNRNDTIIFLDEIQVYPHLITMLKALKKDDRYRYIASGSLLGFALKKTFIPMGSIQEVKMYPMDFEEFLIASGTGKDVIDYLRDCFCNMQNVGSGIHNIILTKFKEYLISGGLPAAVQHFITEQNVQLTRNEQTRIYNYYSEDASQYDKENKLKIKTIYDFLPSYMGNKVKRIQFAKIEGVKGSTYTKYQDEFDYLVNSGCAIAVKAVSDPVFPLVNSSAKNLIKLYYNDVGILSNILFKNNINAILKKDTGINLGSVYETAAAMELLAHGHELYYFDSKKVGEVDFLINNYDALSVMPIEIKSGMDQNNFRAIPKLVKEPYKMQKGMVFGNENKLQEKDGLIQYPIYMIMFV